jgi:hypothetical protein
VPLVGLICYCRACKGEKSHDIETVLEHAARRDNPRYPYELLNAMVKEVQDRGKRISATTVLSGKCLRSEVLRRTRPYVDDPKKLYASFRGTMFHGRLEVNAHENSIAEARFHKHLDGLGWFSGSPDLLDPLSGYLFDWKFTKQNPVFDYPWKDHREQVQVNRWLVDHCDYVELPDRSVYPITPAGATAVGEEFDREIAQDNAERFRPVDWQGLVVVYMDDSGPKPILVSKSIDVPQKGDPTKTKKARVADIWSDDRVEALVREGYFKAAEALDGDELPPIPPDYESWKHPLCGYCPVRDFCVDEFLESEVQVRLEARMS